MRRVRLFLVLARPAVVMLVALFALVGLAQAGHANDPVAFAKVLAVVLATLVFAVAVNDLADERIDRVNLPADTARPLVAGTGTRREMIGVAAVSAFVALAASLLLQRPAIFVVGGGLLFTAAYSLRPVRIAERGVLAPMLLPAGYVAVPYLLGVMAVRAAVTGTDLLLLAGLYAGFVGRILLKDFRDVRGDTLFGKRTFLVRHGRGPTCALSAVFLIAGMFALAFVRDVSPALVASYVVYLALTLVLLRTLARSASARRDEASIAAIAILGRGMLVTLYGHFAMSAAHWSIAAQSATVAVLTFVVVQTARDMAGTGPITRLFVPFGSLDAPAAAAPAALAAGDPAGKVDSSAVPG